MNIREASKSTKLRFLGKLGNLIDCEKYTTGAVTLIQKVCDDLGLSYHREGQLLKVQDYQKVELLETETPIETFKVKTDSVELVVDNEHPFWTDKGFTRLKNFESAGVSLIYQKEKGWAGFTVEPNGTQAVLDIKVPDQEYYYANNILVHNCSQRIRDFLHKAVSTHDVLKGCEYLIRNNCSEIKLFMIATGQEDQTDIEEFIELITQVNEIKKRYSSKCQCRISVMPLYTCAFTPLQFYRCESYYKLGQDTLRSLVEACRRLSWGFRTGSRPSGSIQLTSKGLMSLGHIVETTVPKDHVFHTELGASYDLPTDALQVFSENNKLVSVKRLFNSGMKIPVRVKTKYGYQVTSSIQHRWRVVTEGGELLWKETQDLKVGDRLLLHLGDRDAGGVYSEIEVGGLDSSTGYFGRENLRIKKQLISPILAEIVGYHVGDGSANRRCLTSTGNGRSARVKFDFNLKEDVALAEVYKEALEGITGVSWSYREDEKDSTISVASTRDGVAEFFDQLGVFEDENKKLSTPAWLYQGASPLLVAAYLRGLFTSDGSVRRSNKDDRNRLPGRGLRVGMYDIQILRDAQQLLATLGIKASLTICQEDGKDHGTLSILTKRSYDLFGDRVGFANVKQSFLEDGGLKSDKDQESYQGLDRVLVRLKQKFPDLVITDLTVFIKKGYVYYNAAQSLREQVLLLDSTDLDVAIFLERVQPGLYELPVEDIDFSVDPVQMYDLEVDSESSAFNADGFISHNSKKSEIFISQLNEMSDRRLTPILIKNSLGDPAMSNAGKKEEERYTKELAEAELELAALTEQRPILLEDYSKVNKLKLKLAGAQAKVKYGAGWVFVGTIPKHVDKIWTLWLKEYGLDPDYYFCEKDMDYVFPWDAISVGVDKKTLYEKWLLAKNFYDPGYCVSTLTKKGSCNGCGGCPSAQHKKWITSRAVEAPFSWEELIKYRRDMTKRGVMRFLGTIYDPMMRTVGKRFYGRAIARAMMKTNSALSKTFLDVTGHSRTTASTNDQKDWVYGQFMVDLAFNAHYTTQEIQYLVEGINKVLDGEQQGFRLIGVLGLNSEAKSLYSSIDSALYRLVIPHLGGLSFKDITTRVNEYRYLLTQGKQFTIKAKEIKAKGAFRTIHKHLDTGRIKYVGCRYTENGTEMLLLADNKINPYELLESLLGGKAFQYRKFEMEILGYYTKGRPEIDLLSDEDDDDQIMTSVCAETGQPVEIETFSKAPYKSRVKPNLCISADWDYWLNQEGYTVN